MNQAEFLGEKFGLSVFASSRWSGNDDSWWSSWGVALESESKNSIKLSAHIGLLLVGAVMLENELIKGGLNTANIHFVFEQNLFGNSV